MSQPAKYTIKFCEAPEGCPTGFADFATLDALIESKHFKDLYVGDAILRRNSTGHQLFAGQSAFEDITSDFCDFYYFHYCGVPDLSGQTIGESDDNWPDLIISHGETEGWYTAWECHVEQPDWDVCYPDPKDDRTVSSGCLALIQEHKAQQVSAQQVAA